RIIIPDAGRVGVARSLGVDHILGGGGAAAETWIANTDADSCVPPDWLTRMVREAEAGAHPVLGTVSPSDGLNPLVRRRWSERHQLTDRHPHIHGANFGIRGDVYKALGG